METARVRLSTEARQAEIVAAVVALASARSPALITTGDIARAVGLSQGAVFRHFPSKDAIWLAVVDWVEGRLLGALEAAEQAALSPLDGLGAVFMAHVGFVMAYPGVPRLIFNELQQPDDTPLKARVRDLLGRYRRLVMRLLAAAGQGGQLGREVDPVAAATLFIGTIQGLVMQSMLAGGTERMDADAEGVLALYLGAIRGAL